MGKIEALYTLEVKDKDGKTVSKITKPCNSFVLQFLQIIEAQSDPNTNVSVKDTSGTPQTVADHATNLGIYAPVTNTNYGIVVGTGTTPEATDDYVMETLIAHGAGAGQLNYGSTSLITSAEVGANVDLQIIRTFTNSSGGTINVTEIGIYCICSASFYFMILHEIVASTPVADGQTLTVVITYRTTV